ncbi:hypothetical protein QBK97_08700 [Glaesserella parasuis]|nr:hypothetical protein [Glaesserella parasuis]WGE13356.1 hypothetical protein QBK97_08700 [Glaesserella parasuis]
MPNGEQIRIIKQLCSYARA